MASSACQLEGRTPSPGRPSEAGGTMPWRGTMPRGSWAAWAAWAAWVALAGRVGAPTPWAFRDAGRADGCGPKGRCLSNRLVRGRKWREGGRHYGAGEVARGTRKREAAGREGERVAWERAAHLQGVDKGCRPRATRRVPRKRAAQLGRGKSENGAWRQGRGSSKEMASTKGRGESRGNALGAGHRHRTQPESTPLVYTPIGAHRHRRAAAERSGDGSEAGR